MLRVPESGEAEDAAASRAGVFVIGATGTIEDVDAAACALVGYSRDELVGLHGSELIPLAARPATAVSIDRMRRGEIARRQGRLRRKDGAVILVEVSAGALQDGRLILSVATRTG